MGLPILSACRQDQSQRLHLGAFANLIHCNRGLLSIYYTLTTISDVGDR